MNGAAAKSTSEGSHCTAVWSHLVIERPRVRLQRARHTCRVPCFSATSAGRVDVIISAASLFIIIISLLIRLNRCAVLRFFFTVMLAAVVDTSDRAHNESKYF